MIFIIHRNVRTIHDRVSEREREREGEKKKTAKRQGENHLSARKIVQKSLIVSARSF